MAEETVKDVCSRFAHLLNRLKLQALGTKPFQNNTVGITLP